MASLRMTIGPDPGQTAGVREAFAAFAEVHKVPPTIRRSVGVALDELLTNAFAHGSAVEVSVEAEVSSDRLCVTLRDDGKPFNPLELAVPDTGLSVEERKVGGLGIHLVRQMMDDVVYQRQNERNVITLTKLLA